MEKTLQAPVGKTTLQVGKRSFKWDNTLQVETSRSKWENDASSGTTILQVRKWRFKWKHDASSGVKDTSNGVQDTSNGVKDVSSEVKDASSREKSLQVGKRRFKLGRTLQVRKSVKEALERCWSNEGIKLNWITKSAHAFSPCFPIIWPFRAWLQSATQFIVLTAFTVKVNFYYLYKTISCLWDLIMHNIIIPTMLRIGRIYFNLNINECEPSPCIRTYT